MKPKYLEKSFTRTLSFERQQEYAQLHTLKKQKEKQEKIEREKAMLIFGKSKSDWKALELYYRREWLCFVVGFVLGVIFI